MLNEFDISLKSKYEQHILHSKQKNLQLAKYEIGQIVQHIKYGFRGVIIGWDVNEYNIQILELLVDTHDKILGLTNLSKKFDIDTYNDDINCFVNKYDCSSTNVYGELSVHVVISLIINNKKMYQFTIRHLYLNSGDHIRRHLQLRINGIATEKYINV